MTFPAYIHELPQGIHENVPPELYYQRILGVASKSSLDLLHRAPSVYRNWIDTGEEVSTPALDFGHAFHCALLEPDRFVSDFVVRPDFGDCRFKENKTKRDAWTAANEGKLVISDADMTVVRGIILAAQRHPLAARLLRKGSRELTLRWTDPGTGIECKARADWYVEELGLCLDLKSTIDASLRHFRRDVATHGYHRQEAFYREGFERCGKRLEHFVFLACEKAAPFLVGLYALDARAVENGRASVMRDLETLRRCIDTDTWPGLPETIETIHLPTWAIEDT